VAIASPYKHSNKFSCGLTIFKFISMSRRVLHWLWRGVLLLCAGVLVYQMWIFAHIWYWVDHDPVQSSFMERRLEAAQERNPGAALRHRWIPYERISIHLKRAMIAAEDAKFTEHEGFDWEGIQEAYEKNLKRGKVVAGGSTISQQLAKNLYLSPSRNPLRKLRELIIARRLEAALPKARIFEGNTQHPDKLVSMFEAHTEVIRKGKASKPTEFGKMVKVQEAEHQIVTHYEVYEERPADSDLLVTAVETHEKRLGGTPHLVAADAGFYSQANEKALEQQGVKRISIPSRNTKSEARKKLQKQRWFKDGQRWRTGCEGRISVLKRRHGLDRCLYRGQEGMKRWVGLGVIADNLINIGLQMAVKAG